MTKDEEPDLELTDFDWIMAALALAYVEDLTLEEIHNIVEMSHLGEVTTGEQFDTAVTALIALKGVGCESF